MKPSEVELRVVEQALEGVVDLAKKLAKNHPSCAKHIAYGLLGVGVSVCDSFRCDVEGWLADLRAKQALGALPRGGRS